LKSEARGCWWSGGETDPEEARSGFRKGDGVLDTAVAGDGNQFSKRLTVVASFDIRDRRRGPEHVHTGGCGVVENQSDRVHCLRRWKLVLNPGLLAHGSFGKRCGLNEITIGKEVKINAATACSHLRLKAGYRNVTLRGAIRDDSAVRIKHRRHGRFLAAHGCEKIENGDVLNGTAYGRWLGQNAVKWLPALHPGFTPHHFFHPLTRLHPGATRFAPAGGTSDCLF